MTEPLLLRRRDAAERLAVSVSQILKWEREGKLRAVRVPGIRAVRYASTDVDTFARQIVEDGRVSA